MWYFVCYNGEFVAQYKRVKSCVDFIDRKGWVEDWLTQIEIVDSKGELYNIYTGVKI